MIDVELLINIAGWAGAAALLSAYAMVSTRRMEGDSPSYQGLNVGGSVLLLLNSFYYGAYPSVCVNVVWAAIGIGALIKTRLSTEPRRS